jgi:Fe-S cluster assembly protein SufD
MSLATVIERSHRDKESWRYTNLDTLLKANYVRPANDARLMPHAPLPSIIDDASLRHQIVFVNGRWRPEFTQLKGLPNFMEGDANNEYRLTLEGQTCLVTAPIELVFVTENEGEAAEFATRLDVKIGANTSLTIVEHHIGGDAAHVIDTNIHLGAQSKLVHGKILHRQKNAAHLARTEVRVEEGGYYRNFALIKDTKLARNEIEVTLAGKLAQCALNGIMLLHAKEHADTLTRITHAAPFGVSRQLYKSIVKDQAHGVFQGKIIVAEDAQKTDGRQLSRALLLSDQAEMDAKPELEIYADDVQCSHGCTVGDLDADALFYMRSRGLSEDAARALLLRAFIDEVIDEMHGAEGHNFVRAEAGRWLDE